MSTFTAEYWPSLLLFGVLIGATCIILGIIFLAITIVTCRRRTFPGTESSHSDLRLNNMDQFNENTRRMRSRSIRSETHIQDEGGGPWKNLFSENVQLLKKMYKAIPLAKYCFENIWVSTGKLTFIYLYKSIVNACLYNWSKQKDFS